MAQQPTYCKNCGQPINPGASFCMACGTNVAAPVQKQRRRPSIILILVGLLLILVGLRAPVVMLFGASTSGNIINVKQRIDSSSDRMDYNYQITYQFTIDSKKYTGSYDMNKVYNVTSLPGTGSSLRIKYIPGFPYINTPANQGNPGLVMLFLCGLGVLLLVAGITGNNMIKIGRKK